jgi:hypothetical protein
MQFNPMSEQEIKEINLMEVGVYQFQVMSAVEKKSKNGNSMIDLIIKIWDKKGRVRTVFDNLVDHEAFHFKIRNFAICTGQLNKYESGIIAAQDCLDKSGYLRLGVQKQNGNYAAKNIVQDYMLPDYTDENSKTSQETPPSKNDESDDDIPW